jgi:hypothetical protein
MGKVVGFLSCINQASLPLTGLVLVQFGDGAGPQAVGLVVTVVLFAVGLTVLTAGGLLRKPRGEASRASVGAALNEHP